MPARAFVANWNPLSGAAVILLAGAGPRNWSYVAVGIHPYISHLHLLPVWGTVPHPGHPVCTSAVQVALVTGTVSHSLGIGPAAADGPSSCWVVASAVPNPSTCVS